MPLDILRAREAGAVLSKNHGPQSKLEINKFINQRLTITTS